jgi:hypothetical protein
VPFRSSPDYFLISEAAAATFAVARLLQFRMSRQFPALIGWLVVAAARAVSLSVLLGKSKAYEWVYLIASPVVFCVAALSVREMFALVFRDYPGLRTAGRWVLYAGLILSVIVSAIFAKAYWRSWAPGSRGVFYELVLERSVDASLAAIIVVMVLFLSRYPLDLDRNVYVATGFFSAMFLVQAASRFIDSISPHFYASYADYTDVCFTAACFVGWGIMLRPVAAPRPPRPPNKPREIALLHQIESLNEILVRSGRR